MIETLIALVVFAVPFAILGMAASGQQKQSPDPGSPIQDMKTGINATIGISQILSMPIRYWFSQNGTIGERYGGWQGPVSLIVFPVVAILAMGSYPAQQYELYVLGLVWLLTVARVAGHANVRRENAKKGVVFHSQYSGTSVFWKEGRDEVRCMQSYDSGAGLVAGILLCILSPATGGMVIVCSIANIIAMEFERQKVAAIKRDMRDAMQEQEVMKMYMDEVKK